MNGPIPYATDKRLLFLKERQARLDEFRDVLVMASDLIFRMNFGVEASVSLNDAALVRNSATLKFGKREGKWGLYVEKNEQTTPIENLPLSTRIAVANKLEALVEALFEASNVQDSEIQASINRMTALIKRYGDQT